MDRCHRMDYKSGFSSTDWTFDLVGNDYGGSKANIRKSKELGIGSSTKLDFTARLEGGPTMVGVQYSDGRRVDEELDSISL